ncbi:MAG: hypothetical protein ACRDQB_10745, partial [Thermocrispum sp.]
MTYPPQDPHGQHPQSGGWPAQQPWYGPPQQQYPGAYPDPGYPGYPGYPDDEPPKKKTGLIVGVVVVLLLLAAVGLTGFWQPGFFLADDKKEVGGGGEPSGSTAPQVPGGSTAP